MAAAGEGGERRVFVKKVKDREERVSVPAAHPRFANFEELLDTCMVEYVSFDIVETPDRGFTVVAARDIDKGEVVMYENAVISAVDEEGAQSLLDNYVHYRKSDRAAKCDPYLKFMASDVELSQQDTDALDATYDNYVQKLGGETADVSKEELLHILKVSRANFYDHAIEFEHPATKKPTKVTLTNCYPVIALINHSCDPNVDQSYNIEEVPEPPMTFGSVQMFCEATRKIKKGEEIAISYFDQTELRKRYAERALAIRAARHFDCQCSKCLKEKDKKGGVLGFFGL